MESQKLPSSDSGTFPLPFLTKDLNLLSNAVCGCCLDPIFQKCIISDSVTDEEKDMNRHQITKIESCEHLFHSLCIQCWAKYETTCPLCRCIFNRTALYSYPEGNLLSVSTYQTILQADQSTSSSDDEDRDSEEERQVRQRRRQLQRSKRRRRATHSLRSKNDRLKKRQKSDESDIIKSIKLSYPELEVNNPNCKIDFNKAIERINRTFNRLSSAFSTTSQSSTDSSNLTKKIKDAVPLHLPPKPPVRVPVTVLYSIKSNSVAHPSPSPEGCATLVEGDKWVDASVDTKSFGHQKGSIDSCILPPSSNSQNDTSVNTLKPLERDAQEKSGSDKFSVMATASSGKWSQVVMNLNPQYEDDFLVDALKRNK